jgi:hypothetical protein
MDSNIRSFYRRMPDSILSVVSNGTQQTEQFVPYAKNRKLNNYYDTCTIYFDAALNDIDFYSFSPFMEQLKGKKLRKYLLRWDGVPGKEEPRLYTNCVFYLEIKRAVIDDTTDLLAVMERFRRDEALLTAP